MVEISIIITLISLIILGLALVGRYVEMKHERQGLDSRDD